MGNLEIPAYYLTDMESQKYVLDKILINRRILIEIFCILNQIILIYAVNLDVFKVFYDCIGVGLAFEDFRDSRILRILSHIGTGQPVSWGDILHRYMECWATIFANCWHKLQFVDGEVLIAIPSWVFLVSASFLRFS